MSHSPQSPAGSVSSCSSPIALHTAWNHNTSSNRLGINSSSSSNNNNKNNNNNNNNDDYIDDDIFGSAAWRKKRGSKRGGKTHGQENGSGAMDSMGKATKNEAAQSLAVVRVLQKGAQVLKTAGQWVGTAWLRVSTPSSLSKRGTGPTGGAVNGQETSTASTAAAAAGAETGWQNGAAWKTAGMPEPGSYELTTEVLVQQARLLCGNYIYHRLCSKGLMSKRVHVAPYHSLVSEELCCAGQELERLHPKVYSDVSRRIAMTMSSAQLVRRMLTSVLEGTFKAGVTWAKVVSMVVIAAAFAEECVVQGHPNFVEDVVMCVGHFVMLHLTGWLAKQGGWSAFPTSRPPMLQKSSDGSPALMRTALLLFGFAIFVLGFLKLLLGTTT